MRDPAKTQTTLMRRPHWPGSPATICTSSTTGRSSGWTPRTVLGVQPLLRPVVEEVQIVAGEPGQCGLRIRVVCVFAGSLIPGSGLGACAPEPPPSGFLVSRATVDHQSHLSKLAQVVARGPTVGVQNGRQCGCRGGATES